MSNAQACVEQGLSEAHGGHLQPGNGKRGDRRAGGGREVLHSTQLNSWTQAPDHSHTGNHSRRVVSLVLITSYERADSLTPAIEHQTTSDPD
jgi:hypothetical protein